MKTQVNPFNKYKKEYWKKKTTKSRKGEILDTIEELTEMHRKAIVRKFKRLQFKDNSKKISRLGRPKIYDSYDDLALKKNMGS